MGITALVCVTLVVVGLQALFWITGQTTSTQFLEVVANFLQFVTVPGMFIGLAFRLIFPREVRQSQSDQPLYPNDPWRAVPGVSVTPLDKNAVRLDGKGRAFIVVDNGKAAREIDPTTGEYVSNPIYGTSRGGRPAAENLAHLINYKINTGT